MSEGSNKKLQRFGQYLILDHLIDGGMAKICRARILDGQVDKIVIIKMVQPQFSNDESFRTMFMDEIKVTYGLLHPNIVQTYEYGLHDDQLFVAMEYCDGRNLKEYFDKLKNRKFVFPVEISVYIMTQVCQGLNYAHTFADKLTGKEARIIHRDISPHNIMLTYDGAVKVIDFGIAKSQTNSEATQAGTIKGKLSYLAPEYLDGLELDPRYDEFATGITLWEMLCSRKLFKASNDLAVLKKIQECHVPAPSSINPNVPKELDEIVLKALSKDRNDRYDNLDQLNRALIKFLYSNYPDFNSSDLSYFAKELFKDEIKKDKEKLYSYGRIDIQPYLKDLSDEKSNTNANSNSNSQVSSDDSNPSIKQRETEYDFGYAEEGKEKAPAKNKSTSLKTNSSSGDDSLLTDLSIKANSLTSSRTAATTKVRRAQTTTRYKEENKASSSGLPIFKVASVIAILAFGYIKFGDTLLGTNSPVEVVSEEYNDTEDADGNLRDSLDKDQREPTAVEGKGIVKNKKGFLNDEDNPAYGKVRFTNIDKHNIKMKIFVNDKLKKLDFLGRITVPKNEYVNIRVQESGKKPFIYSDYNLANDPKKTIEVRMGGALGTGSLKTSSDCEEGVLTFEIWGEKRMIKIPIASDFGHELPGSYEESSGRTGPREYNMIFVRDGESIEHRVSFTLETNAVVDFCKLEF